MKISDRFVILVASALASATLAGCVAPMPVYQTSRYPYQAPTQVAPYPEPPHAEYGQVASIEVLRSESAGAGVTGAGAVTGSVVGGLVGSQLGRGRDRAAATAVGVVGGALLGNAVEAQQNAPRVHESYRVSVQIDDGGYRTFDVPSPGDLRVGDRVRIGNGRISRM